MFYVFFLFFFFIVFFQIVPHVVNLVQSFKSDGLPSSSAFLVQFSELMHCMIYHYSGFPDLYEPILEALKVKAFFFSFSPLLKTFPQGPLIGHVFYISPVEWGKCLECLHFKYYKWLRALKSGEINKQSLNAGFRFTGVTMPFSQGAFEFWNFCILFT